MKKNHNEFYYAITEVGEPTSLDPLDADRTNNLPAARMLYLTPLEISPKDEIYSTILSSFSYDEQKKKMTWTVREGLTFEDGTPITVDDVAFSVARMLYTREKFPVIRYIKGLDEWKRREFPLESYPDGIKIEGNKIFLQLTKHLEHPLFRFTLELFSIIPKRCVDLRKNIIVCGKIPESGYYKLVGNWKFERREKFNDRSSELPKVIEFSFLQKESIIGLLEKGIDDNWVIASNEEMLSKEELEKIHVSAKIKNLVFSRFYSFLLSSKIKPFDNKECRQIFAMNVRREFAEISGDQYTKEDSIFTKLVSGYVTKEELRKSIGHDKDDKKNCLGLLNGAKIDFAIPTTHKDKLIIKAILNVSKKMGISLHTYFVEQDYNSYFCEGKSAFILGGSGFWPLDPVGDIQMFLTPNLHKPLDQITQDSELQETLKNLDDLDGLAKVQSLNNINKKLYDDALINVYQHFGRIFITNKNIDLDNLPISVTAPAPWQVFK